MNNVFFFVFFFCENHNHLRRKKSHMSPPLDQWCMLLVTNPRQDALGMFVYLTPLAAPGQQPDISYNPLHFALCLYSFIGTVVIQNASQLIHENDITRVVLKLGTECPMSWYSFEWRSVTRWTTRPKPSSFPRHWVPRHRVPSTR